MGHRTCSAFAGKRHRMTVVPFRKYAGACLLASLLLFGLVFTQPAYSDISLQQADGETLVIPQAATRIIALSPNLAEIVFAAGDDPCGFSGDSRYPYPAPRINDTQRSTKRREG